MNRDISKNSRWTRALIEGTKVRIKSAIDAETKDLPPKERLDYISDQIVKREGEVSSIALLEKYVFLISTLVHHTKYGGLENTQISEISSHVYAILKYKKIKIRTSRLSFLYFELHSVLSQVYRKKGAHWNAAWEHALADYLCNNTYHSVNSFNLLSTATRSMRLGQIDLAKMHFHALETGDSSNTYKEKGRLGRIKALRLSLNPKESLELATETSLNSNFSEEAQKELNWEIACNNYLTTGDLIHILSLVKKGEPHYSGSYIVEAWFWMVAQYGTKHPCKLPKMRFIIRKKSGVNTKNIGRFFKLALALENCFDDDMSIEIRISNLGRQLRKIDEVISIDKELLIWVGVARWLSEIRSYSLANLALGEYQRKSLSLSAGRSRDVLKIAADLFKNSWSLF